MKIKVRFFARCRELVGSAEVELQIPPETTVTTLKSQLKDYFPRLQDCTPNLLIAVNSELTDSNLVLREGDEVALLPPLSGG